SIRHDFCRAHANISIDIRTCRSAPARGAVSAPFLLFRMQRSRLPPLRGISNSKGSRVTSSGLSTALPLAHAAVFPWSFAAEPRAGHRLRQTTWSRSDLIALLRRARVHRPVGRAAAQDGISAAALSAWHCGNAAIGLRQGSHSYLAGCCDQCASTHPTAWLGEWPLRSGSRRSRL